MPATYRSSTHSGITAGLNYVTLNKPAGLAVGDVMIAVIHHEFSSMQYPKLSGWTLEKEQISTILTVNQVMAVLWKRATAADVSASNFTFIWTDPSTTTADMHAFYGCTTSGNPFFGDTTVASGGSGTVPSVSYTAGTGLGLWLHTSIASGSTVTIPTGYTSVTNSPDGNLQLATRADTAGATSSGAGSTTDTTNPNVTFAGTLLDQLPVKHTAVYKNNAEGGVDGASVTRGNSGEISGSAWSRVTVGSGASATYASMPARGNLSYKFTSTATPTQSFVAWEFLPDSPKIYTRFNLFVPALPAANTRVCDIQDGTNIIFSATVRNDGRLALADYTGAQMALSTMVLPLNKWVRVELRVDASMTSGQASYQVFMEPDSPFPYEKGTSTATFNTKPAGDPHQASFGLRGSATNITWYLDDIALSNSSDLGPADGNSLAPLARQNNADMGSDNAVVTLMTTGDTANDFLESLANPSTITFSSAQKSHGTLSYLVQPVSGSTSTLSWMSLATPSAAVRVYAYFTGLPPISTTFVQFMTTPTGSNNTIAGIRLKDTGEVNFVDSVGTVVWTSSAPIALNTWYRFELKATLGGTPTTGSLEGAYYALDNTTAIDGFSSASITLGSENFGAVHFGKTTTNTWTDAFYLDGLAVNQAATGLIGVYSDPSPQPVYQGVIPSHGWGANLLAPSAADSNGLSFLSTASSGSTQASYTFSNMPLGKADETRTIIVGVVGACSGTGVVETVTIAGVHATIDIIHLDYRLFAIARAEVPTGTIGDVVVTFSGGSMYNAGIGLWRYSGGAIEVMDKGRASGNPASLTVGTAASGFAIAISVSRFPSTPVCAWTGVSPRFSRILEAPTNEHFAGADQPTTGGSVAITGAWPGGTVNQRTAAVAYQIV